MRLAFGISLFSGPAPSTFRQKHQIRLMRPDQLNRLNSIGSLRENIDTTSSLQQILQLLPGQRFIIDDECSQ